MRREYKIGISLLLFAAVTSFFYYFKVHMNESNAGNHHLLSTAILKDELKDDIFQTDFFETTTYSDPLTKEAFLNEAERVARDARSPRLLKLSNLTHFESSSQSESTILESVSIAIIKHKIYLLLKEHYLLLVMQPETSSEVFQIDGTGQVGLASKTIRYNMSVINEQRPEEFLALLPSFVEKIQSDNGLSAYESQVFISSKWGLYLYSSSEKNQLIKVEEIS